VWDSKELGSGCGRLVERPLVVVVLEDAEGEQRHVEVAREIQGVLN
jgi:hypothetical protein